MGQVTTTTYLRALLEQEVRIRESMYARLPSKDYSCQPDFVLRHGKSYLAQPLPVKYRPLIPKQCYYNSYKMICRYSTLRYVEGYVLIPDLIPIHHAWCVAVGDDKVLDFTLSNTNEAEYLGVQFASSFIKDYFKKSNTCILDDWQNRWPLFAMTQEQIKAIVVE